MTSSLGKVMVTKSSGLKALGAGGACLPLAAGGAGAPFFIRYFNILYRKQKLNYPGPLFIFACNLLQTMDPNIHIPEIPQTSQLVLYLQDKCFLPPEQITRKLINGENFQIKGEGNDLDTGLMEAVLHENDFYEKANQKQLKDEALKFVKTVVEDWSISIAKNQRRINNNELPYYSAKVLTFGSYVLDLRSNSSDIDLVCVVPNFINRETHFFQILSQNIQADPQVTGLSVRKTAKVPIITFDYKEINIDISFCKLESETIPRDIERVISLELINSIEDEKSRTSLLGRKNNRMILELAGAGQTENFKQTLRLIKVWAKNRGVSSNAMGFLGGISWAIMLAKICQIFPYHKPARLLLQFFNIYRWWNWKELPVQLLKPTEENSDSMSAMMTIITPGSYYNSTERVNEITFQVLTREIYRASEVLSYQRTDFETLCQKIDFRGYNIYLEIDICGKNLARENDYKDFLGSVEAKILILLKNIIKYNGKDLKAKSKEQGHLQIVPNPKLYKKTHPNYDVCQVCLLGINLKSPVNLRRAVADWCSMIDTKQRVGKEQNLNVHLFQCQYEEFETDVEITEVKKKEEKEDPRLAMRARRQ